MNDSQITDLVAVSKNISSKELAFRAEAQNWLNRMSLGFEPFRPLITSNQSQSLIKRTHFMGALALWTYPSAPVGAAAGLATFVQTGKEFFLAEPGLVVLGLAGFIAGAVTLIGVPLGKLTQHKSNKKYTEVYLITRRGLKNWLKARYDIEVSKGQLDKLMDYPSIHANVYGEDTSSYGIQFVDVDGLKLVLNTNENNSEGWNVTAYKEDKVEEPIEAERVSSLEELTTKVVLPGEANTIFGSISNRVSQLEQYSLETEASHNILRIVQDAREAVATYSKLEVLGEAETGLTDLVEVLSILNEELLAIVRKEASDVRNDLLVQKSYLRSRQLESGLYPKLGLQLNAREVEKTEVAHD